MAETVSPKPAAPRTVAPARKRVKMFRCELDAQYETTIPAGWIPFQVRTIDGQTGVPTVMIWASR
jgi:hypothetical protein